MFLQFIKERTEKDLSGVERLRLTRGAETTAEELVAEVNRAPTRVVFSHGFHPLKLIRSNQCESWYGARKWQGFGHIKSEHVSYII